MVAAYRCGHSSCAVPHCTLLLFGQITEFEYTRAVLCAKYADPLSSCRLFHSLVTVSLASTCVCAQAQLHWMDAQGRRMPVEDGCLRRSGNQGADRAAWSR